MAHEVEIENLRVGDVYRMLNGRGERRLRKVKEVRPFTSGTVPYIIVDNVDPRTTSTAIGSLSTVRGTKVEVVTQLADHGWEDQILDVVEKLKDGEHYTVWAVGSDLYA